MLAASPISAKVDNAQAVAGGHILLALGNTNAALEDFNAALRVNGDSISSLWGSGQVYEAQELPALAILGFKKTIELKASVSANRDAQTKARARLAALAR